MPGCRQSASTTSRPPCTTFSTPRRQPRLKKQFCQAVGRKRHLLARLEHEAVAAGDGQRVHPHGHHSREIERRDASAHPHWLARGSTVNAGGQLRQHLALGHLTNTAGQFDDLNTAAHIAPRFLARLAIFAAEHLGQMLELLLQQLAVAEQNPRPLRCWRRRPVRKGPARSFHR